MIMSILTGVAMLWGAAKDMPEYPFREDSRPARRIVVDARKQTVLTAADTEIVVGTKPTPVARYAAQEMQCALNRIFRSEVPIVAQKSAGKKALLIGIAPPPGGEKLCADSFVIRTAGGDDIYIYGSDDPAADPAIRNRSGIWDQLYQRGTLFGVYDFLERFAGVRYFFPGEKGTVYPVAAVLRIPEVNIFDRPDFEARSVSAYHGEWYEGTDRQKTLLPGRNINDARQRMQTTFVPVVHGLSRLGLLERFGKKHPEYFALLANGRRHNDPSLPHPGQLCLSSEVKNAVCADAAALLSGNLQGRDFTSGAIFWNTKVRPGFVDLMPQDGLSGCLCVRCRAAKNGGERAYSNFIWDFQLDIAEKLKREKIPGYITMMSYWPYHFVPERKIPDNVMVMVAKHGPWGVNSPMHAEDLAELKKWRAKLNRRPWLWNYANKFGNLNIVDLPNVTPRAIGRYYRDVSPYITGAFMQSNTDRYIFNYLNFYIFGKVAWNNSADVEALLSDHFRKMFGAGHREMADVFAFMEDAWLNRIQGQVKNSDLGPVPAAATGYEIFEKIYSPANLAMLDAKIAAAKRKCSADPAAAARIDFMAENMLEPIKKAAAGFRAANNLLKDFRLYLPSGTAEAATRHTVPLFPVGNGENLRSAAGGAIDGENIYFVLDMAEPAMAGRDIGHTMRDSKVWNDDSVEIFLKPSAASPDYFQFVINSDGAWADIAVTYPDGVRRVDLAYDSGATVKVTHSAAAWRGVITIPRRSLRHAVDGKSGARLNIIRNRRNFTPGKNCTTYSTSPLSGNDHHDTSKFIHLLCGEPAAERNILADSNFIAPQRENTFGKWYAARRLEPGQSYAVIPGGGFAGGDAMVLKCTQPHNLTVTQQLPQLKPSSRYRLSYYMKTRNVRSGVPGRENAGGCVSVYDVANNFLPNPFIKGDTPYRRYEFEFKTSPRTGSGSEPFIRLSLMFATGEATFSNVRLECLE